MPHLFRRVCANSISLVTGDVQMSSYPLRAVQRDGEDGSDGSSYGRQRGNSHVGPAQGKPGLEEGEPNHKEGAQIC